MPFIHLTTFIAAPAERVFNLSRDIAVHRASMTKHLEEVVDGKKEGLMEKGETVTWQARHLGKTRTLKVAITEMDRPHKFVDEQIAGNFKSMKHEHYFKPIQNGTIMIDQFYFETPYGFLGKALNAAYLTNYMTKLLEKRNAYIRQLAEKG